MLTEASPIWFSSRALSFPKGHIQANIEIPTKIFEILLMKISTLLPSLNLQSAFPLHLYKTLLKNTSGLDDGWDSRMVILRGVWRRGSIYTSLSSFTSAMPGWCLYSSPSVGMAQYSDCNKDTVQWCTEGTQIGLLWVSCCDYGGFWFLFFGFLNYFLKLSWSPCSMWTRGGMYSCL